MQPIPGVLPVLPARPAALRVQAVRRGPLVDTTGTFAGFEALVSQALSGGARGLLVLTGQDQAWPEAPLEALLRGLDVPVCGAVVPRVLAGAVSASRGTIVWPLEREPDVSVFALDASRRPAGLADALAQRHARNRSLMVLADGGADSGEAVELVRTSTGAEANLFGARIGPARPGASGALYTNAGRRQGMVQVVGFGREAWASEHAVGWQPCGRAMIATRVDGNVIHDIDGQPAGRVYLEAVERLAGVAAGRAMVSDPASYLPLGLQRLQGGFELRQPVALDGDRLVCAGPVPAYAELHLLRIERDGLARAAAWAAASVRAQGAWTGAGDVPTLMFVAQPQSAVAVGPDARALDAAAVALGAESPIVGAFAQGVWVDDGGGGVVSHDRALVISQPVVRR